MSIEEKAKAYDKAYKKVAVRFGFNIADEIFPELTESDDERIRKYIINHLQEHLKTVREFLNNGMSAPFSSEEIKMLEASVAWLEKQGQGDQKPTDTVDPKFKVGDWINGYYTNYKVLSVSNKGYVVEDTDGNKINILFENEKFHHLFTFADAKDGDVLVASDNDTIVIFRDLYNATAFHSYCYIEDGVFSVSQDDMPDCWIGKGFHPATKEQRDLLFKKIHETGYEWDAEELELKKIEQGLAWSEEDENRINRLIAYFEDKESFTAEDDIVYANWLKSLKERHTWKPSYEQMEALWSATEKYLESDDENVRKLRGEVLESLYEQLRKLREE